MKLENYYWHEKVDTLVSDAELELVRIRSYRSKDKQFIFSYYVDSPTISGTIALTSLGFYYEYVIKSNKAGTSYKMHLDSEYKYYRKQNPEHKVVRQAFIDAGYENFLNLIEEMASAEINIDDI